MRQNLCVLLWNYFQAILSSENLGQNSILHLQKKKWLHLYTGLKKTLTPSWVMEATAIAACGGRRRPAVRDRRGAPARQDPCTDFVHILLWNKYLIFILLVWERDWHKGTQACKQETIQAVTWPGVSLDTPHLALLLPLGMANPRIGLCSPDVLLLTGMSVLSTQWAQRRSKTWEKGGSWYVSWNWWK